MSEMKEYMGIHISDMFRPDIPRKVIMMQLKGFIQELKRTTPALEAIDIGAIEKYKPVGDPYIEVGDVESIDNCTHIPIHVLYPNVSENRVITLALLKLCANSDKEDDKYPSLFYPAKILMEAFKTYINTIDKEGYYTFAGTPPVYMSSITQAIPFIEIGVRNSANLAEVLVLCGLIQQLLSQVTVDKFGCILVGNSYALTKMDDIIRALRDMGYDQLANLILNFMVDGNYTDTQF